MKKLIYLFILFTSFTNAQILDIPDAVFKAKLLNANTFNSIASTEIPDSSGNVSSFNRVDTNFDGQIDVSEASVIKYLNLSNASLTEPVMGNVLGINSFYNLELLFYDNNVVSSINLSNLTNLRFFSCGYNYAMTTIDLSGLTNLKMLNCARNHLTSLDVSSLINLEALYCNFNLELSSLNVNGLTNLRILDCSYNQFSDLNINNLTNLQILQCSNNQLTSLNISALTNLQGLDCSENLLTNLDISNLHELTDFDCSFNNINFIDFSNCNLLEYINCSNNSISFFDFSYLPLLNQLYITSNQFTNLDLSSNSNLHSLYFGENLFLETLNLKNGVEINFDAYYFQGCNNLHYICIDEYNNSIINSYLSESGININNISINSYCSFTPGGNYNTIYGNMKFDANANGCDALDLPQPNIKININDGTNQGATFTNNSGNYVFYTDAGSFDITPNVENPTWFTFSPTTTTISFADNNNNVTNQNFCIAANGIHNDLEIVIAPITPARPGFDAVYQIVYKNKGNQTLSGNITYTFDDTILDFVSATVNQDTQSTGLLNWNYTNLLPFESRSFYITLNVNSPVEIPAVNIDNILTFQATITPVIGDEIPSDNLFTYNQTVVGAFDPNDITCLQGENVSASQIGEYLHYVINFENTGNSPAENIVVKTEIDATQFDVNSLQMLNTSHNAYIKQTGNVIEFIFENILLDTGGHGNVLLKVKTNNALQTGDTVSKIANIFFDYNAPINTNLANTTFQTLSNVIFEVDNSITVYPNPASSIVNINSNNTIKSIQLYDVQGRLLQTQLQETTTATIDVSNKQNGIYFVKITSDKGVKVEKLVKE